jgi:hypothetical protein
MYIHLIPNPIDPTSKRRLVMVKSKFEKVAAVSLLASALWIIQAGAATAAEPAGDAQWQARELLSRSPSGFSGTASSGLASHAAGDSAASPPAGDPQDQARALLVGTHAFPAASGAARPRSAQLRDGTDRDGQAAARRMILGDRQPSLPHHFWE